MQYHTTDIHGVTRAEPDRKAMQAVLATLRDVDIADYDDVSLVHASGDVFSLTADAVMVWERTDDDFDAIRVMRQVTPGKALQIWELAATGDMASIEKLPWEQNP